MFKLSLVSCLDVVSTSVIFQKIKNNGGSRLDLWVIPEGGIKSVRTNTITGHNVAAQK